MKNKKLSLILALVIIFQLVLIVSPTVYESIVFNRCEKYGEEYKIQIPSLQIDIYDPEYRDNSLYINVNDDHWGRIEDKVGFMLNDKGFCVFDLYGNNKDKHIDSVKREFLSGKYLHEDDLIFSEGVTLEGIAKYLEEKTGQEHWGEYYLFYDVQNYDTELYIAVRIYKGVMIYDSLFLDGVKVLEFR